MQQPDDAGFAIGDAVGAGWRRFWPHILPMALFALIVWAVNATLQALQGPEEDVSVVRFLFTLLGFFVGQLIAIGWVKLALDITDGKGVSAEAITDRFRLVLPYLVAALIYSVMVSVGLVLLVVPGIIVAIIFAFYGFHIVDTGQTDPIAALRRSAEITRGHRGHLFLLGVVLIGINLLGLLALVIGVLITSGISLLAIAYVYRQLAPAVPVEEAPSADPFTAG